MKKVTIPSRSLTLQGSVPHKYQFKSWKEQANSNVYAYHGKTKGNKHHTPQIT
jgi:hypothetical protein